jgi:hypothetical protein
MDTDRPGPGASRGPITSETPTSPHLSRLVWLGEQIIQAAEELAEMLPHDGIAADLNEAETTALRAAMAAARTAGGDLVLLASSAHDRAAAAAAGGDHA